MAAFNLNRSPVKPRLPASLEAQGYEAVKQIGKGSFGLAYLVENTVTRKQFVAKLINTAQMSAAEKKEAHNEIKMLQQLEHPYIVRYVDYQEDRAHLYIIMEYADGGDLASHIAKVKSTGRPMPEREAMRLFTQTALALKHMHDRRMLHRDIKAQNVFMTKSLDVKMGDFGISTVLKNTMAMAQTVCGTPYYFSPELCAGRPYNNKSDIWALGVLLYNICTGGDMPFDATSMKGLMEAIMKRAPRRLSGPYGAEVNDLISSMLQKDSKKRPNIDGVLSSTAVQMHCAELIAGVSLTSGTDSPPASGRSPSRSPEVRRHSQLPPIPRPPQQQQAGQYLTPQPSPKHTPNPSPKHSPMPSPHVTPQRSPARSPARVPPMRAGGAALDNGMAASPHAVDNYYYHPAAGAAAGAGAGALPRYRPLPRVVDVRAVAAVAGGGGGGAGGNNGGARASPVRAPWV